MIRDFKSEYQSYINDQTPDLWGRIEENLPEKTEAYFATVDRARLLKIKRRKRLLSYGVTAAAGLLICVAALPIYFGGMRAKSADMAEENKMVAADGSSYLKDLADAVEIGGLDQSQECENAFDMSVTQDENDDVSEEKEMNSQKTPGAHAEKQNDKMDGLNDSGDMRQIQTEIKLLEQKGEKNNLIFYRMELDGQESLVAYPKEMAEKYALKSGKIYSVVLKIQNDQEYDYLILFVE